MKYKIWFDNLSIIQKIQLYIIPILFFSIYYINFNKKNIVIQKPIVSIVKKDSQIKSIKFFEDLLKELKINNTIIDINNKIISITVNAKFKNILIFLNQSSNRYKVISYNMYKKDKLISLDITYDTNINVTKHINNIKYKYKNPFKKITKKRIKNSKAIIGNFVMINSKWYKLNDTYKKYKIIKINKTSIILSNIEKTFEMELF